MSENITPGTDNRIAHVVAQTYTDLAVRVLRDDLAAAKAEIAAYERKHRIVKVSIHLVVLAVGLTLALAFVASPVVLAVVTGAPAFVIEFADVIIKS